MSTHYRGRFAPSPTGPLHFGSLVSALASYLDAKKHHGDWIVRIEDVDGTRCKTLFSEKILNTLNSYQLFSDETVRVQSNHTHTYEHYLSILKTPERVFPCNCTRQSLSKYQGFHPHQCDSTTNEPHSWRLKASDVMYSYHDPIQGKLTFAEDLKNTCPILKRKDDYFSYQLAVVVDDHQQSITHLVRGADLIDTTAQQLHLYSLFGWDAPNLCHIPLITNNTGEKISKQNHAKPIPNGDLPTLLRALHYLKIDLDAVTTISQALDLAVQSWEPNKLKGIQYLRLEEQDHCFI